MTTMISNVNIENGRLRSIGVKTGELEFAYSFYEHDSAVSLYIARRFNEDHRRAVETFVAPGAAEQLIVAFATGKEKEGGEKAEERSEGMRNVLAIADAILSKTSDVASVRLGDDVVNGKRGVMATFGYELKPSGLYYVFAEAEWRGTGKLMCHAYEADMVKKEDVKNLKYYLENVISLVGLCQ
jgi:hypothetical protein